MNVLQVSAEIYPLLKTGGLADIAGALPAALRRVGCEPRAVLPGFPTILADLEQTQLLSQVWTPWGESVTVLLGRLKSLDLMAYVIEAPALYQRPGDPYADAQRQPYADNDRRFALLGFIAALLARGLDPQWAPNVVHCHDWHAALTPAYMRFADQGGRPRVASVYTVHNLAYQGLFGAERFGALGLPASAFSLEGLEFHGNLSFMKAGLYYADRITTVSPTYAREIQTPEQGCGLDGLLRQRADVLSGILNAVDTEVWDPRHDAHIPSAYDANSLAGKARCKKALQQELGLEPQSDFPLFGVVSRLTEQKGLHLVLELVDDVLARGGQLVVLGNGEAWMEQAFRERAAAQPQALAVRIGYDERFAHRIFAATDVTVVPSRFEPCGLTQMYGLRYGSLPLVRRVGGLADTVVDASLESLADGEANGFVFDEFSAAGMAPALRRAFALFARRRDWLAVRQRAMRQELGWGHAATRYLMLYQSALAG